MDMMKKDIACFKSQSASRENTGVPLVGNVNASSDVTPIHIVIPARMALKNKNGLKYRMNDANAVPVDHHDAGKHVSKTGK